LRENPDKFNAVLMDVQMPIMDGLTATRIIRQDLKLDALPIIAVTAGVMAEEKQKALDAGITDFLPKPMDLNRMVEIVQGLCR